jgi:ribonuclease HI
MTIVVKTLKPPPPRHVLQVYTDASVRPKRVNNIGVGMYISHTKYEESVCHSSLVYPKRSTLICSNYGELSGIIYALHVCDTYAPLMIYTDSQCSLDMIEGKYINGRFS